MPRVSSSTKAASKDGSDKSSKKLPGGGKPVRHRRSVAGCLACRIRGKPCDQQLIVDANGLTTCIKCHKLKIACIGGFGERKVPDDQWKYWYRLRVKLYMRETGKVRGIKGWSRSGTDLRKTPLALEEINGFVDSHVHLSREEGELHETCIFYENGVCPGNGSSLASPVHNQLLMSPANTDTGSDFTQSDYLGSPIIPLGHHIEGALFEPVSPDTSSTMSLPRDANSLPFAPYNSLLFSENHVQPFAWPTQSTQAALSPVGLLQYGVGLLDINASSPQLSDSEVYDALLAEPTINDADYLDPTPFLLDLMSQVSNDDSQLSGFINVYDA